MTADPDLIEQVIINLVMNSIKALSATVSPMIKLIGKVDERGGTIIQVVDNGQGIPEELLEKDFHPIFYYTQGRLRHRIEPIASNNACT